MLPGRRCSTGVRATSTRLFVRAEGCRLWDATGHELVDLTSGVSGAAIIGQGREDIATAMADTAGRSGASLYASV